MSANPSPPQSEPLDRETEKVILDFERTVSTYRSANFHDQNVRLASRAALRNRIRELVEEARRMGLPKDVYSLEMPSE